MPAVEVNIKGQVYSGTFEVRGSFVFVDCWLGAERAVLGLYEPKKLAKHLLKLIIKRNTVDGVAPVPIVAKKALAGKTARLKLPPGAPPVPYR